jgi:hypothetical protein
MALVFSQWWENYAGARRLGEFTPVVIAQAAWSSGYKQGSIGKEAFEASKSALTKDLEHIHDLNKAFNQGYGKGLEEGNAAVAAARQKGYQEGRDSVKWEPAYNAGKAVGHAEGKKEAESKFDSVVALARQEAYALGVADNRKATKLSQEQAVERARKEAYNEGHNTGYAVGKEEGTRTSREALELARSEGYKTGWEQGNENGKKNPEKCVQCYAEGFEIGKREGQEEIRMKEMQQSNEQEKKRVKAYADGYEAGKKQPGEQWKNGYNSGVTASKNAMNIAIERVKN